METVLCNNNWMAVSFHVLPRSPSAKVGAKREEEGASGWPRDYRCCRDDCHAVGRRGFRNFSPDRFLSI